MFSQTQASLCLLWPQGPGIHRDGSQEWGSLGSGSKGHSWLLLLASHSRLFVESVGPCLLEPHHSGTVPLHPGIVSLFIPCSCSFLHLLSLCHNTPGAYAASFTPTQSFICRYTPWQKKNIFKYLIEYIQHLLSITGTTSASLEFKTFGE